MLDLYGKRVMLYPTLYGGCLGHRTIQQACLFDRARTYAYLDRERFPMLACGEQVDYDQ